MPKRLKCALILSGTLAGRMRATTLQGYVTMVLKTVAAWLLEAQQSLPNSPADLVDTYWLGQASLAGEVSQS